MNLAERARLRVGRVLRRARWRLAGRGDARFACPVCLRSVPEFEPLPDYFMREARRHGYPYRPEDAETLNARAYSCPWCGATDRDRLCALYLSERLDRPTERRTRLLEFAPSAALARMLRGRPGLDYQTADLAMEGVDHRVDVTDMPFPDGYADVFLCSHVLEHVPDDRRALRELRRVLSPEGWGILMVPIVPSLRAIDEDAGPLSEAERWRRFGQGDHVRLYDREGFLSRTREAGFAVSALGLEHFGERLELNGITAGSRLYVVEHTR